jgi:SAM-dependent methyltransferase
MKDYSLQQRADFYSAAFPKYPPLVTYGRWIYGAWEIGNNFKNDTRYFGAYPPSYLKRVNSLFPDAEDVLHLFSGELPAGDYIRFDGDDLCHPDVCGDAHRLSNYFGPMTTFDLIIADPPYNKLFALKYRYGKMVNRRIVMHECWKILRPGGFIVWLDIMRPQFRKDEMQVCGNISLNRSTNTIVRMVSIFQKPK